MSHTIERDATARVPTGRTGRTESLTGTVVVSETGMQFHYSTSGRTRKLVVPRDQIAFVGVGTTSHGDAKLRITTKEGKTSEFTFVARDDAHAVRDLLSAH